MSSVNCYKRKFSEKERTDTTKADDNGHLGRELGKGLFSPALSRHEGAQTGNVLTLQTETSLETRKAIHQATKADSSSLEDIRF